MTGEGILCHAGRTGLLVHTVAERMLEREENERREKGTEEIKTWRDTPGRRGRKCGNRREDEERPVTTPGPDVQQGPRDSRRPDRPRSL